MPIISRFYGIIIAIYFRDHAPAHLHAKYAGDEALLTFDGRVLVGQLPPRALVMVRDWMAVHRGELQENWRRAQIGEELAIIAPLE